MPRLLLEQGEKMYVSLELETLSQDSPLHQTNPDLSPSCSLNIPMNARSIYQPLKGQGSSAMKRIVDYHYYKKQGLHSMILGNHR